MATGWDLDRVTHLDVLTFNALMDRMVKLTYSDRSEAAWVSVATTNAGFSGKTSGIKKLTNAWLGATGSDLEEIAKQTGRDGQGFMRDFGLMRGGKI